MTSKVTLAGIILFAGIGAVACVPADAGTKPSKAEVSWKPAGKILDQGETTACTGFALAGMLGKGKPVAMKIYALSTKLDTVQGTYPKDDTGSELNAAAKAAKRLGYIQSYKVLHTANGTLKALKSSRVAVTLNNYPQHGQAHAMILLGKGGNVLTFQSSWGPRDSIVHVQVDEFKSSFVEAVTVK